MSKVKKESEEAVPVEEELMELAPETTIEPSTEAVPVEEELTASYKVVGTSIRHGYRLLKEDSIIVLTQKDLDSMKNVIKNLIKIERD